MTNKVPTFGSRIQVYRGHAKKTSGGLTKSDLMMNKHGRVVSKAKHFTAKKEMRLLKHGFGTKKGKFGFVKVGKKSKSRKMKGGMAPLSPLDLGESSGAGITNFGSSSNDVQMRAGMSGGSGMAALSSHGAADWSGDSMSGNGISGAGITDFGSGSSDVQMRAGMSGGRGRAQALSLGRAKARSRGAMRSRGKGLAMRGGTGNRGSMMLGSDSVQVRAGLGN